MGRRHRANALRIHNSFDGKNLRHGGPGRSVSATPLFSSTYDLCAFALDAATGKKLHTLQGHTDFVMNVALSRDGKQPWTVSLDGTVRLWNPDTGKELCRLYSFDAGKDWLVVTPEGHFDGAECAAR